MKLTAITRDVNSAMDSCELTFMAREPIDTARAIQQHVNYQSALSSGFRIYRGHRTCS